MNHKYNPWVSMVALLLLALILVFTCTGCTEEEAATQDRFTVEYVGDCIEIITDNQTGEQYLSYYRYHTGIGLCKLEG